jgi:predicted esterase
VLLGLTAAAAQRAEPPGEIDAMVPILSDGRERSFRLVVPAGDRQAPRPAIVLYNGSGSRVDPLIDAWRPVARREGIVLIGPTAFAPGAWRIPEDSPAFTHEVVMAVRASHAIDERRVYLFGHSGGAHQSLQLAVLETEYFAAVAVHAGALQARFWPALVKAPRRIPVGLWIGTADRVVPLEHARATRDALRREGFPVRLVEFKDHGHGFSERGADVVDQAWRFLKNARLPKPPVYQPYSFGK